MGFFTRLSAQMAFVASMAGVPGCVVSHYGIRSIRTDGVRMTVTDDNGKQTVRIEGTCASDADVRQKVLPFLEGQCTNGHAVQALDVPCVNGLFRAEVLGCRLRESPRPRLETQFDIPLHK